ncbi:TlpA family protein disulfide reductase [Paraconexibacter antarcticus]|uniref:TlpA family protein disulfide reductase n=1 Tax=Paraconexibacter antarcticus TaxID=2949664 RepID=A0ABY5DPL9_9ACTN|nr:TlpA disulfide reductase family protein [Paraconexibacter antarcticus]UTI63978.1 TlpA family protein disulfide reductase [Paraconexibacter antarcticus]
MLARRPSRPQFVTTMLIAGALGLGGCGVGQRVGGGTAGGPPPPPKQTRVALERLRAQADQLLDGGPTAFGARLASLRGVPVVVNQWASWCGPCRFEFPSFQHLSARYRGRVAFLGVDAKDSRADAAAFLKKFPVPYPHFYDENGSVARTFGGGRAWPTTAFFAAGGKLAFTHVGAYADEAALNADIVRYALHG